jgi:MFS family permease
MSTTPRAERSISIPRRYRWWALAVLTLAQLCHSMDRTVISLVLEPIGKEFGLTDRALGLLAGLAYGIAFAAAAIPLGLAADRIERRKLLTCAIAIWSGCTALCGIANSFLTLVLARAAVGAAESGATPTSLSLLADYFPREERATAVGIWYMGAGFGTVIALLAGGYIVEYSGWRGAFFAAGLPGLALAAILFLTIVEPPRGHIDPGTPPPRPASFLSRLGVIASVPGLPHCMFAIILTATTLSGTVAWLVTFFIRVHGLGIAQSGLIVALCVGLLSSLGGGVAGAVVDRINRRRARFDGRIPAYAAAAACTAAFVFLLAAVLVGSLPACIGFLTLGGLCLTGYNGPANGLFITLAPQGVRALAVAILQFWCNLVGWGVGPLIVGSVSEAVGPAEGVRWGIAAVLLFNLWSAGHFLLLARRIGPRPFR